MNTNEMNIEEFLNNVNNPPENIQKKQIWYSRDYNKKFLIIDDEQDGEDYGIYVALLLSSVPEVFADGIDVVIEKSKFPFLASDKLAMRLTRGPVHKEQLDYYLGEIDDETFHKILKTTKVLKNNYDEDQQILFSEILEDLEFVRAEAINLLEEKLEQEVEVKDSEEERKPIIIYIDEQTTEASNIDDVYIPAAAIAANSIGVVSKIVEFWEYIVSSKKNSVIKEDKYIIDLVKQKKGLYFVVYSNENMTIENISIEQNNKVIEAKPSKLELEKESKTAAFFSFSKLTKGKAKLIFKINSETLVTREIIFE